MEDSYEFTLFSSSILFQPEAPVEPRLLPNVRYVRPIYANEAAVEGCHKMFINQTFDIDTEYKLEAAQKWITFPGEYQVKFPLQTILPKVQMHRQVPPKQLPRDVEVDRRRRRFAKVKISDLLRDAEIPIRKLLVPQELNDLNVAFEREFFIPLDVFDDNDFDSNSVTGWFETGRVGGELHPLPAWALIKNKSETFEWSIVAVYSYDESTFLYNVIDLPEARSHQVYRIQLMFMAESPFIFVDRIKYALQQRALCEARIRYQLLFDFILFDKEPMMPQTVLNRIISASCIDEKKYNNENMAFRSICNEIRLNYDRIMTSYVFEEFLNDHADEIQGINPPSRSVLVVRPLPYPTTLADHLIFKDSIRILRVATLFYLNESIQAMISASTECIFIESFNLFVCYFPKPLQLPDFLVSQDNSSSTVIKYLKYVWPEKLSGKICLSLRSIGKGWLDILVRDWDIYDVAKLSRFFIQIKFRMQESLEILLRKSIIGISHALNAACMEFLDIDPDFEWGDDLIVSPFHYPQFSPVFKVLLQINADGPVYSTDPSAFEPATRKLLYKTLMATCGIHIIDPDSIVKLNFAKNLFIYTVELIEDTYIEHDQLLHNTYSKAVYPLNAYLKKYECFVDFYLLVVDEFITDFANADKSSQEVKNEIIYQKEQKQELRTVLPEEITIGSFLIVVESLKNYLIAKRTEIIRKLFLYYIDRMYFINEALNEELSGINTKLNEKLVSIEHLFEIRDYMAIVPDKLTVMRERIQIMMIEYNVLDYFLYNLSDMQFNMKWEAFAWPYKITKRLYIMKEEQKVDIEEFKRLQNREVSSFQERLEGLNDECNQFSLAFDPEKALEVAVDAKKTSKLITELQNAGEVLRIRQDLFEAEPLSLDYLDSIISGFNPYRLMWYACSDLIKLEEMTVGNPLAMTDVNEIRVTLAELKATLERSVEVFSEKDEVANVARYYLKKVEDMNPILDTMDCVKNENWLLLHWQELHQKSGVEIKYSTNLNFLYCIKKGILNHVALVKDICERAVREADDIRRALEEEERLRIEAELALLAKKASRKCRTDIL